MALPTTRIYLRSPYYVTLTRANLNFMVVHLYIYTGTLTTDKPSDPQYIESATAMIDENASRTAWIDIASLARDYVEVEYDFDQSTPTNTVWLEWDVYYTDIDEDAANITLTLDASYTAVGFEGYGYFYQEENPAAGTRVLQTNRKMIVPDNTYVEIPVLQDDFASYQLYKITNGQTVLIESNSAPSTTENTANVIDYVSSEPVASEILDPPDRVVITFTGAGEVEETIDIEYADCGRYDPIEVAFVNRYGAVQRVYFFGKQLRRLNTESTKFKRNILTNTASYDKKRHQDKVLNKNGRAQFTLSSGWYTEGSNGMFHELMLSEKVWCKIPRSWLDLGTSTATETTPVTVNDSNIEYKTRIDDKLINYNITFELAADVINSVR